VIFLFEISPKLTRSLELELRCTNLPTLTVNQSSSHAYPVTFHRQMFIFSPLKTYHQMHGDYSKVYAKNIQMKQHTSTIGIMIEQGLTNLPVVHDSFVSEKAKCDLGPLMHSGLSHTHIPDLDFFEEINKVVSSIFTQSEQSFFPCFPCVGNSENKNLTSPQRKLLLWHWKLGINMYWVQELMHDRTFEEPLGKLTILPPIYQTKIPFCLVLCHSNMSVLPPCLCQEEDSQCKTQYGYP
jgi:hypothetical protein